MTAPLYFGGKPNDLGNVVALKHASFKELVEDIIRQPVKVACTRAALHAMPEADQNRVKRTRYITACTFKSSPSPRTKAHASHCNLIFLDIDRADDARRLLESDWGTMLPKWSYVVYHTARSTPDKPRLRIMVSAEGIPVDQYPLAVERIAGRVGVAITRESLVVVQPMFVPTTFQSDPEDFDLVFIANTSHGPFTVHNLTDPADAPPVTQPQSSDSPISSGAASLDHFRAPMEGITVEDVQEALDHLDPDCSMMQWIEVGAALKHQFKDAAWPLWLAWSQKGKKFTSESDTRYRFDSFKGQTKDRVPVTIRSLFRHAQIRGWKNDRLSKKAFEDAIEWLKDEKRSTEELFDRGAERIAKAAVLVSGTEKGVLLHTLRDKLKKRGMHTTLTAIKRDVEKLEVEAERKNHGIPAWVAGLVYVTSGNFFYRYNVDRRFTPEVVDLMYTAPQLGEKAAPRTSAYLVKDIQIPQVESLLYEPSRGEDRIFSANGVPYINTYRQTYLRADPTMRQAAADVIAEHVTLMATEDDYQVIFLDYLTYLVQNPGRKIRWAPLVQSTKGAGKTWWHEVMAAVLGQSNVMKVMPSGIMDSPYNDWAYGHQLLTMEEVRFVGKNRFEVMDKLKPCISDDSIALNVKFESHRTVPNLTNYLLFTNYHDALAVQDDERRYFVIQSPVQRASQVRSAEYFTKIYDLLKKSPGGFRAYFEERTISRKFEPDGRAPGTKYLAQLAEAASSPLHYSVGVAIADAAHPLVRKDLVSLKALRETMEGNVKSFTDQGLSQVLRDLGWTAAGRARIGNDRHTIWVKDFAGSDPMQAAVARAELL